MSISSYKTGNISPSSLLAGNAAYVIWNEDPYAQYLQLAMPLNANWGISDYSATIKNSGTNKTITAVNSAGLSSTVSKFYTQSLSLTPYTSNKYLSAGNNSSLYLGSADFTIEGWYYFSSTSSGYMCLASHSGDTGDQQNGWVLITETNNGIYFYASSGGGWQLALGASTTPNLNAWNHVAVCRSSGTTRLFLNGNVTSTNTASVTIANPSTRDFRLGDYVFFPGGERGFSGYIQDFRLYNGTGSGKYTAAFTPPGAMTTIS